MNFYEGQRVIAVANGYNYGRSADSQGPEYTHDYAIGDKGTVSFSEYGVSIITFDNGRSIKGCDRNSFEELKEETKMNIGDKVKIVKNTGSREFDKFIGHIGNIKSIGDLGRCVVEGIQWPYDVAWFPEEVEVLPQLSIGSKVIMATIGSASGAMEFKDGILTPSFAVKYEVDSGQNIAVYKVTGVVGDQTILRRISDSRVFFVQSRFLKEYVVVPKFTVGQVVEHGNDYRRIAKVNKDLTYVITCAPQTYEGGTAYREISEDRLKAVAQ